MNGFALAKALVVILAVSAAAEKASAQFGLFYPSFRGGYSSNTDTDSGNPNGYYGPRYGSSYESIRQQREADANSCVYELQYGKYNEANNIHNERKNIELPDSSSTHPWSNVGSIISTAGDMLNMVRAESENCKCKSSFKNNATTNALLQLLQAAGGSADTQQSYGGLYSGYRSHTTGAFSQEFRDKWMKRNGVMPQFIRPEKISAAIAGVDKIVSKSCQQHFRVVWNFRLKTLRTLVDAYSRSISRLAEDNKREEANTYTFKQNMKQLPPSQLCSTLIQYKGLAQGNLLLMRGLNGVYIQEGKVYFQRNQINFKKPFVRLHGHANGIPVTPGTAFGCRFQEVVSNIEIPQQNEPLNAIRLSFYGMPFSTMKIVYPISYFRKFQDLQDIDQLLNENGFDQIIMAPDVTRFMPDFMYDASLQYEDTWN